MYNLFTSKHPLATEDDPDKFAKLSEEYQKIGDREKDVWFLVHE